MRTLNLENIVQGDTKNLSFTIWTDSTKTTKVDISDYDFWFTVKSSYDDTDENAKIAKDPADFTITDNIATLTLSSTDTNQTVGTYYYDVQYKDADDNIVTIARGLFKVIPQVTIRTT